MKINYKVLFFVALISAVLYFDYPTLSKMFLDTKADDIVLVEKKYEEFQKSLKTLKGMNLSLVELDKSRIRILKASDYTGEIDLNEPSLKAIIKDNFTVTKEDQAVFLSLKNDSDKDIFLSDISGAMNQLFDNVKKIKSVELKKDVPEILVTMEPGRRIAEVSEPINSFIGDELDWVYNAQSESYSATKNESPYTLSLGLDLKGGIYLDLGVDSERVIQELARSKMESLKTTFASKDVDYDDVVLHEDLSIEIKLFTKEMLDIRSDDYVSVIEGYDIEDTETGFTLRMIDEERSKMLGSAIDQAMTTIRNRIDQLGVKEPIISKKGKESIIVQLPGVTDPDRAVSIIKQSAVLEFRFLSENGTVSDPGPENEILIEETKDPISGEVTNVQQLVVEKSIAMKGSAISDARVAFNQLGTPYVSLTLKADAADLFGQITSTHVGRRMAIVLDGKVQSAPNINEPIYGGLASISGNFTVNDARDLALILRSGALPAPLVINEQKTVGASLGLETINKSMLALIAGFVAVLIFMVVMYRLSGFYAVLTLLLNLAMLLAFMSYFGATLTLPGLAGIILTVGMAVDANVLIYERIREELLIDASPRRVIETSFKRVFGTILDSNLTTLLSAIILFQFGSGPIKGFAVTLSVGIFTSMFSSLTFTKLLLELTYYGRKKAQSKISV